MTALLLKPIEEIAEWTYPASFASPRRTPVFSNPAPERAYPSMHRLLNEPRELKHTRLSENE
jgi:hypothetical protein